MDDPSNPENNNAGNGGDLVKHTVYLATLHFLLTQEPWKSGMNVRECHAGRGVYRIPHRDVRTRLLVCLQSEPTGSHPVLLQSAQKQILGALGCASAESAAPEWYAGSALINAFVIRGRPDRAHRLDLYEWLPETRGILRSVLTAAKPSANQFCRVLPEQEQLREFDGEAYIQQQIRTWGKQDVILLDPFAMWRQPSHQGKRDRYRSIMEGLLAHGTAAPSLILFWTWGRAFPIAEGDLNGTNDTVRNGYAELRTKSTRRPVRTCQVAVGSSVRYVGPGSGDASSGPARPDRTALWFAYPSSRPAWLWFELESSWNRGKHRLI